VSSAEGMAAAGGGGGALLPKPRKLSIKSAAWDAREGEAGFGAGGDGEGLRAAGGASRRPQATLVPEETATDGASETVRPR
jgi:hypothetical protein